MKKLVFVFAIVLQTQVFSQAWMHSPYLTKTANEANYNDIRSAFNSWWGDRPYAKGKGYMPFKRWEYINQYRTYPDGNFPEPGSYYKVYQDVVNHYKNNKHNFEKTDVSNWIPLGLTAWVNGNEGNVPGNGRVNAVAVDPNNSQILYIASAAGGIWKSVDGGQNWNTTFDQMPVLGLSSVAIHPDSSHIVFAGTGDREMYGGAFQGIFTKAQGIYKSTDGGNTWTPSGMNNVSLNPINKIIFNPQNPKTMFASANDGIYRSSDGGDTWVHTYSSTRVTDLLYHPADTNILYGGGCSFVISTNAGNSFSEDNSFHDEYGRREIAVTPANPSYVYVLATDINSGYGGTYRSVNSGASFTLMSDSPNYLGTEMDASDSGGQGWYDLAIAVSPVNANEVYIGGINVWKSTNGGSTYNILSHWMYDDSNPSFYTHADIHYLGFYGNILYCGSDGGVFYTDDSGASWVDISEGLGISQVYRLASSPVDPYFIVCGTQDNGSNKLQNGIWTHVYGADGMQPMTHRTDTNTYYFSAQWGLLLRTTDNGNTVDYVQPEGAWPGGWTTPFDMHPTNSNTIYGGYEEIYKSTDAGDSWDRLSFMVVSPSFTEDPLQRLKVSPVNPDYIYASRDSELFITKDDGLTWTTIDCGYNGLITGIALSYTNPEELWVAVTGSSGDRIFYSNDAYASTTNITGSISGIGIRALVHQKDNHHALFVGTENAVLYKDTTISAWIPYVNGLPNVIIEDLEINYTNNMLRAGTHGRGIWETPIPLVQTIEECTLYNKLSVFPNPSNGVFQVDLSNIENIQQIIVFDITGKKIIEQPATQGIATLDMTTYVSGTYFIKVTAGQKQYVQKIILHN